MPANGLAELFVGINLAKKDFISTDIFDRNVDRMNDVRPLNSPLTFPCTHYAQQNAAEHGKNLPNPGRGDAWVLVRVTN